MKKRISYPTVLLVGRTNVGKSTLFNRLVTRDKSIVFEREGVTRDYIEELLTWNNKTFNLIDTGGLSFKRSAHEIQKKVEEKVLTLLKKADLLLFVCDAKNGLTKEDILIAKTLRKVKKPIFLLLNKADSKKALEDNMAEFYSLGIKDIIETSGIHGTGTGYLLRKISETVPDPSESEIEKPQYKIVIIGKPNVGKSSLMNLLIQQERSIVSDVAGTTREAVSENIYHCSDLIQVTDTAGVRKRSRIDDDLESLMVKSSLHSIKEANVVLLMIDVSEGKIADQELKLLFYTYDLKKPLIILFNKTDLLIHDDYTKGNLNQSMDEYEFILKKVPQISISCLTQKNVGKILSQVQKVIERCNQHFNSTKLDEIVKGELTKKPMYHKRILLRMFKIRSIKAEVPTFVLHVNHPQWYGPTQLGFIENIIRDNYDLKGCPIQLKVQAV